MSHRHGDSNCGCCSRREFVGIAGTTVATAAGLTLMQGCGTVLSPEQNFPPPRISEKKKGATVKAAFIYPPSKKFADNPNGWWSWPGTDFNAEGRHKQYTEEFGKIAADQGMTIDTKPDAIVGTADAQKLVNELKESKPDGLLIVLFYNRSLKIADYLLKEAGALGIPTVFYIALGVKHGAVGHYRRKGVYFIQSLDNFEAIADGMRMINAKKILSQSRLLSITNVKKASEKVEKSLGITIRTIPFEQYATEFGKCELSDTDMKRIRSLSGKARSTQGITPIAKDKAMIAHLTLLKLIEREKADAVTMTCLKAGMLKPCISFSQLNNHLFPAICENDMTAALTQMLGQQLTGRAGFQHNPCFETEKNHYFASHCTCPTKLHGPEGPEMDYLLRRFLHSNEGSCAIQVFWKADDPVTMVHYYPGDTPKLDVYAGRVIKSHFIPPAGGCTTNVEIAITDRPDACMVKGHHNILYTGKFAGRFRTFAQLYGIELAAT